MRQAPWTAEYLLASTGAADILGSEVLGQALDPRSLLSCLVILCLEG